MAQPDEIAFAFAVLVESAGSNEPVRDMMCTEVDDAIKRASKFAKEGHRAYVFQLLTIVEPSYHLTDLREKGNG
jgi:hypothetical protein